MRGIIDDDVASSGDGIWTLAVLSSSAGGVVSCLASSAEACEVPV